MRQVGQQLLRALQQALRLGGDLSRRAHRLVARALELELRLLVDDVGDEQQERQRGRTDEQRQPRTDRQHRAHRGSTNDTARRFFVMMEVMQAVQTPTSAG